MADFEVDIDLKGRTRPVGRARSNRVRGVETILFEYDDAWLDDADRFSLQPALALTRGAFAPPAGLATFGSIGDSAPDTWGRRLMQRAERRLAEREGRAVRTLTESDYLLGVANETRLGALRFRRVGDEVFQAPIGAGVAFANAYRGDGRVSLTFFGEGASNQGQVYETFNMAAIWDLPVIFVIENNQYAMGTAQARSTSTPDIYTRGEAFGIPGEAVDGMDVLAVKAASERATAHCRAGKGPYILEVKTYRYRGHSMSDPAKYRTREEVQKMRSERDPIEQVRDMLLTGKHATEDDLKAIDKEIKEVVNQSAEFARTSPEPALEELWTDIYA